MKPVVMTIIQIIIILISGAIGPILGIMTLNEGLVAAA